MNKPSHSVWWYNELFILLSRLPGPDDLHWTDSQRVLWIKAFSATIDLIITTIPNTEQTDGGADG